MRSSLIIILLCFLVTLAATNTILSIDLIGLTSDGKLLAWHEKSESLTGKTESFVVANSYDLSPTKEFVISDTSQVITPTSRGHAVSQAHKEIKALGIKSGRGTDNINDIFGNYRQLALSARLYLKVEPSNQTYRLEVYDDIFGRSRIVATYKLNTDDPNLKPHYEIKQARLSRDRSTCAAVIRVSYSDKGNHIIDKLYSFRVFSETEKNEVEPKID